MTEVPDEATVRGWLADYLVANIGCDCADIDFDVSMQELGIGSADAVVLSGELSELLDRPISPVEFWQRPTINALARYLTSPESEPIVEATPDDGRILPDEPIAVIGLGCRLPGGIDGPDSLWQFLCEGRSAVCEVPPDRWAAFDDGSPEVAAALSRTTRWGSFLTDIDAFDAEYFEISPREAARIDPQQRLLLEVVREALDHAGIPADSLRHTQTGVFAGASTTEYGHLGLSDLTQVDALSGTGGAMSIIANRVSYYFDLRGPSVAVDTACSSSLVAIHLACRSLREGDSNLAIAAGVNLLLSPAVTRSFDQADLLSPTGACHSFDAGADGFVRGEGCGVAVLKRLGDAVRDGDRVLAVVRGSAVNQDGRSNGLMAPNPESQMAVLRSAYADGSVPLTEVDYVEAHGTGTLLGDPIEARALGVVLGRTRQESSPLLVGAVKSNLGHLEAAAGVAGFLKVVLALQHGHIPANANFQTPNPHIPFGDLHLKVVAQNSDWPISPHPRRAGISSFGFGGTNAHVVVEQGPPGDPVGPSVSLPVSTVVVSGKSLKRIASTAGMVADWMATRGSEVPVEEVAHTLNYHRTQYAKFASICARDRAQAVAGLRALASGNQAPNVVWPHEGPCGSGTVFVYAGPDGESPGMARGLLADEPAFAAAIADLESEFVHAMGFSLQQTLSNGERRASALDVHATLMGLQLALTELWRSYGVEPDAVMGQSCGEVTAAVVAGALSFVDGLRILAARSRFESASSFDPADDALADLRPMRPRIRFISTAVDVGAATPVLDTEYWRANVLGPARLGHAIAAAAIDHTTFIDISPHPALLSSISENLPHGGHFHCVGTLERGADDALTFHTNLNRTQTTTPPHTPHLPEPHVALPSAPWHRTRHWLAARPAADRAGVVLVFPGQGSQWVGMGRRLYGESAVFAEQMDLCGAALGGWVDWSLMDVVRGEVGAPGLERVDVVQPVLWAVMVSLARLWRSAGVVVDAVIGHSQGEIAAACVGGALSLEDGAAVVALRSRLLVSLPGGGAMVSVGAGVGDVEQWLVRWGDRLGVAAVNGVGSVVVSGEVGAVEELIAHCEGVGVWARRIEVDYASHSVAVEGIEQSLSEALCGVRPGSSSVRFFSTVSGELMDTAGLDGRYWYRNIRERVQFEGAVRSAYEQGYRMFVECSPHPVLVAAVEDALADCGAGPDEVVVVPTLGRDQGGLDRFWTSAGQLFTAGASVDWSSMLAGSGRQVSLPTYAFTRQRYWLPSPAGQAGDAGLLGVGRAEHALLGAVVDQPESGGVVLTGRLSLQTHRWLADHAVSQVVVLAGGGVCRVGVACW